jgi:hypothetical protein
MNGSKPSFDPAIPVTYIRENFEPADRLAVVLLNKRTNSVIQRIATAETMAELDFQSWLRYRNTRDRCEVYISMNALHSNAQGRTKHDVATIRHVYLDFDVNGTAAVEELLKREDLPKPNYLINTSPDKWQVTWRVEGFGKEEAEVLQKGLARESGADPAATDCARVLRLPGFYNHKYPAPHLIGLEMITDATYRPERFPKFAVEERNAKNPPGNALAHRGRAGAAPSQSERDWVYAKRALARGESPTIVVAAIANHRRYDKSNPRYYAELTVKKAEQALRIEATISQGPDRT